MAEAQATFFSDENYLDALVKLLATDPTALKTCAHLLKAEDFAPIRGHQRGRPRWTIADRILAHFKQTHEPIGKLLRAEVLEYATGLQLGQRQVEELESYLKYLKTVEVTGPTAITEKIVKYKSQRLKAAVLEEMVEAHAAGQLTDEKWQQLSRKAMNGNANGSHEARDYFATAEQRIQAREQRSHSLLSRVPAFLIDPLDALVRGVGPGQLGLILAPTGRGKSMAMVWMAMVFAIQRVNVLYVTLEDPLEEVENRMDAAATAIPMANLPEMPRRFKETFERFQNRHALEGRLRVVDGTMDSLSVEQIEQIVMSERERGFRTEALLIDYDEFIAPATKSKEKRFEIDSIYIALHQLASRHNLILWTASQSQRSTSTLKILTVDKVAEDLGKARKSSLVLSLGKGEWGDSSIFMWVAKHRHDKSHVGANIVSDLDRMLLYDRDATRRAATQYGEQIEDSIDEEEL